MIYQYMDSKAQEYAIFDPTRAKRLFSLLEDNLRLKSYNIHVIGTNGKGSAGRFITQSLIESGYKVLHFTSPHVFDFRERFYTNDGVVSLDTLLRAHDFLQQFLFIRESSYFEYATFLALVMAQDCDYLVMEAGVGGEFDSTSVLHYDTTIFTRIGLDHKEMLGDTIQSIALTKLRAAQGDVFTHFQNEEVLDLIKNLIHINTQTLDSSLKRIPIKSITYLHKNDLDAQAIQDYINTYKIPYFLKENLSLAYIVLQKLNVPLLKNRLDLTGRFEVVAPNIVVDVGHNVMAAEAALSAAQLHFNNEPFILVYNSYKDKEILEILNVFKEHIREIIVFMVENPRIANVMEIEGILDSISLPYSFFCPNIAKLDLLPKKLVKLPHFLNKDKKYLVFGSFSLVEQFLLWFRRGVRTTG